MRTIKIATALAVAVALFLTILCWTADATENRHYMANGDSLTYGYGTSTDSPSTAYPTIANVRGYGIGGACLTNTCSPELNVFNWWPQLMDSMSNPPKVTVWMIGTNDYVGSSATTIVKAMRELKRIGKAKGIRVVFGTITPNVEGDWWSNSVSTRLALNKWIRNHNAFRGPEYARAMTCGTYLCPEFVNPVYNDVHFNDAGASVMATVLTNWIKGDKR